MSSTALNANLLDRIARVARSNVNNALKNLEDPEKIMEQALTDMQRDLVKIQQSYSEVTAGQRRLLKQREQAEATAKGWYDRAQLALTNGNEGLAREALSRRQVKLDEAESLQAQIDAQAKALDQLYEGMQVLRAKIEEARSKKGQLAARAKRAKAQKDINEMVSSVTASKILGSIGKMTAMEAFSRMEEKVEALEAAAEASAEMASISGSLLPGGGSSEGTSLEEEFRLLEGSAAVDAELEKMKAKVGKASLPPSSTTSFAPMSSSVGASSSRTINIERNIEKDLDNLKRKVDVTWDDLQ